MLPDPFSDNAEFCDDDEVFREAQFRDGDKEFLADVVIFNNNDFIPTKALD
jgi:hypothetical protein